MIKSINRCSLSKVVRNLPAHKTTKRNAVSHPRSAHRIYHFLSFSSTHPGSWLLAPGLVCCTTYHNCFFLAWTAGVCNGCCNLGAEREEVKTGSKKKRNKRGYSSTEYLSTMTAWSPLSARISAVFNECVINERSAYQLPAQFESHLLCFLISFVRRQS